MNLNIEKLCETLNRHIPIKHEGDRDIINDLINNMMRKVEHSNLYWDRAVFIFYSGHYEEMREMVLHSGQAEFVPSDDPEEHPGIVVRFRKDGELFKLTEAY